jgi:MFS family permease
VAQYISQRHLSISYVIDTHAHADHLAAMLFFKKRFGARTGAEDATAYWAYTTSLSLLVVALVGPVLGAIVDILGGKKQFLGVALALGALGSLSLAFWARKGSCWVCSCVRDCQPGFRRWKYFLRGLASGCGAGR